jgi:hypothetical protein
VSLTDNENEISIFVYEGEEAYPMCCYNVFYRLNPNTGVWKKVETTGAVSYPESTFKARKASGNGSYNIEFKNYLSQYNIENIALKIDQ